MRFILIIFVFLDFFLKYLFIMNIHFINNINHNILGIFNFSIVLNTGCIFGLMDLYLYIYQFSYIFLYLFFIFYLIFFFNKNLSCIYILFGIISNFCDRFLYGCVIDCFSINFFYLYLYIFNISDLLIIIGVLLLLFYRDVV